MPSGHAYEIGCLRTHTCLMSYMFSVVDLCDVLYAYVLKIYMFDMQSVLRAYMIYVYMFKYLLLH